MAHGLTQQELLKAAGMTPDERRMTGRSLLIFLMFISGPAVLCLFSSRILGEERLLYRYVPPATEGTAVHMGSLERIPDMPLGALLFEAARGGFAADVAGDSSHGAFSRGTAMSAHHENQTSDALPGEHSHHGGSHSTGTMLVHALHLTTYVFAAWAVVGGADWAIGWVSDKWAEST